MLDFISVSVYCFFMILTYRFRVKKKKDLPEKARAVNFVWNFCGDTHKASRRRRQRWPTWVDLCKLTAGSTKELGIHSDTLQGTVRQFDKSRKQFKKRPRWRGRKSLGWVPFQSGRAIKVGDSCVTYLGKRYPIYKHRELEGKVLCGSFSEDATGKWHVNIQCEVEPKPCVGTESIGVDLGLKDLATCSDGVVIDNPRHYRTLEGKLAITQRAGRKDLARAVHAKIKNRRRHDLHTSSKRLVNKAKEIYVGDVNAAGLAKTRMAKSVLDAGWSMFRDMLRYKAIRHGVNFEIVNEAYSTQTCSACAARSGPRGLEGLGVRSWECSCGASHDRDVNAAMNILASGQRLALQKTESPAL